MDDAVIFVSHLSTTIAIDIDARGHESTNEVSRARTSWHQTQDSRITLEIGINCLRYIDCTSTSVRRREP